MDLNSLWIGPKLPPLQRLCLASAVAVGCRVRLFVYDPVEGIPEGVEVADGREVLGLDKMIRHRESQSVALFSDRFRYEILGKHLGAWIDTDVLFLKAPEATGDLLVGWEDHGLVGSAFIWIRPGHPLIGQLRRYAFDDHLVPGWLGGWDRLYLWLRKAIGFPQHVSDAEWGVIGPDLLTWLLRKNNLLTEARPVSWSCPLPYAERHRIGDGSYDWRQWITSGTDCVHLWNHGLTKEDRFRMPDEGSLLHTVAENCGFHWPEIA